MRKLAIPFLAAAGLALTAASLQAQSVGVEIDVGEPVYGYSDYRAYGPGVYGTYGYRPAAPVRRYSRTEYYGYRADEPVVELRSRSGGCGTYYYWNGDRCVDARNK